MLKELAYIFNKLLKELACIFDNVERLGTSLDELTSLTLKGKPVSFIKCRTFCHEVSWDVFWFIFLDSPH